MLIALLIFNIILIGLTIFTTEMVEHKFYRIYASLDAYYSKRTYKTHKDIEFIEAIINDYKRLLSDTDEEPELMSAINIRLHKEYIGRFSYIAVKNIAVKSKHLMWGIFLAEGLIAGINGTTNEAQTIMVLSASLLMTVMLYFFSIVKGLEEKQESLIDTVIHYIRNIYPLEVKKQEDEKKLMLDRNHLEATEQDKNSKESLEKKIDNKVKEKNVLKAYDIAQMLKNF